MSVTYFGPAAVSKELFNERLVTSPPPVIAIDAETISLEERMPLGFSIATSPDEAWYFRTYPEPDPEVALVQPLLLNPDIKKVFHNAMFDLRALPLAIDIDRCLAPDTKVLKADLMWEKIGKVKAGDTLIGIDEFPLSRVRKLRKTRVESVKLVFLPACRITLANGSELIASNEHPWLAVRGKDYATNNRKNRWLASKDILPGDYMRNGFDIWETDISYDAGYIAGFLDGEGSVTVSHNNTIHLSQIPNNALDQYIRFLDDRNINYRIRFCSTPKGKEFIQVAIYSQRDITRLLGSVRPVRLLDNIQLDGKEPCDKGSLVEVVKVDKLPSQELISIQTTSRTFVAEGFFTHNSNIADTNVMSRLLGRLETALFILAEEVGRIATPAQSILAEYNAKTMLDVPFEALAAKCANDSQVTLALYHKYLPDINQQYFAIEMAVIPILIDMSLRGIKIDQDDRAALEAKLEIEVAFYRKICEEEGFNPSSNQQVGYMLAKRGNFLPFTRSRRNLQVNKEQLGFLDDPLAAAVLSYRNADKFLNTYIKPLTGEERAYTSYSLDIIVGRVQSSKINMQNIPGPNSPTGNNGRYIFVPDSGMFSTGDYSQEHLRFLMYMSGDKQMERVYNEGEMGGDIHEFTAQELRIPRSLAKVINYAIPYGGTPKTISVNAKIKDLHKCSRFLDKWFELFPDAAAWIKGAQMEGLRDGWALPTLFGRRLRLEEESEENMKRKAVNYPILGSDGEIMKRALIRCKQDNLPLAITVHDSITCDGDIEFPIEDLETISPVRIPFEVKKTFRWE